MTADETWRLHQPVGASRSPFVSRGHTGHHGTKAVTVLLAGALAFVAIAVAPRASVTLVDAKFAVSGCTPSSRTQTVIATFTLTNQGQGIGLVHVHLNVDGYSVAEDDYGVPARSSIQRELSSTVPDCGVHTYTLRLCIPHGRVPNC